MGPEDNILPLPLGGPKDTVAAESAPQLALDISMGNTQKETQIDLD